MYLRHLKKNFKVFLNPKLLINEIRFNLKNPVYKSKNSNNKFQRIYHFHIRKCGGTSFNKAFTSYPDGQDNYQYIADKRKAIINSYPIVGWSLKNLRRGDYWYGYSHLEFDALYPLKKNTFTFSFIREPSERLLSLYNMLIEYKNKKINHPPTLKELKWLGNSFSEFLENIPKKHLQNQLFMFSDEFDISKAMRNLRKINFLGITGRDEEKLLNYLSLNFGIDLDYVQLRKSSLRYDPSESEKNLMYKKLEDEYIFFEQAKKYIDKKLLID